MQCVKALVSFFTIVPAKGPLDFRCAWALPYVVPPITALPPALLLAAGASPLLAYALLLLMTGLNHLDGLADVADALMVRDRERARAVLEDPRRGTAGIFAAVAAFVIPAFHLASPWQLVFAEVYSKALTVTFAGRSTAFKKGLGDVFIEATRRRWPLALPALALAAYADPIAFLAATAASAAFYLAAYRHLGGANGDVFGYLLEVSRASYITAAYYFK
ncbi:MAG: adenosylcobinamide-GDP ribazoletransferase [Pyrobaculum sp.]